MDYIMRLSSNSPNIYYSQMSYWMCNRCMHTYIETWCDLKAPSYIQTDRQAYIHTYRLTHLQESSLVHINLYTSIYTQIICLCPSTCINLPPYICLCPSIYIHLSAYIYLRASIYIHLSKYMYPVQKVASSCIQ